MNPLAIASDGLLSGVTSLSIASRGYMGVASGIELPPSGRFRKLYVWEEEQQANPHAVTNLIEQAISHFYFYK